MEQLHGMFLTALSVGLGMIIYLAPTGVAWGAKGPQNEALAVTIVNVLLGWTLVGWVVAMVMALRIKRVRTAGSEES